MFRVCRSGLGIDNYRFTPKGYGLRLVVAEGLGSKVWLNALTKSR